MAITAPLFAALLKSPDVRANNVHTSWLGPWLEMNAGQITATEGGELA